MLKSSELRNSKLTILSAGTDGTDGPTDATGALISEEEYMSLPNILKDVQQSLGSFDSYYFFQRYGGLIVTGPTQTNVMDLMVVLIA